MATLERKPAPGVWNEPYEERKTRNTLDSFYKEEEADLAEYEKASAKATVANPVGFILRFGVADGSALYRVTCAKPFKIQHIPYGDGYRIPLAHIRGLRISEVKSQLDWNSIFKT
jgi:hypothetical protein